MLIVSDHILVTDANSFELLYGKKREAEPGMGMVDTVSRYYEVRSRSPVMKSGREGMSIEIVQPSTGAVSTTASSLGERTLSENDFHPVTTALNRSRNLSWTYFFIDRVLHVFQGDLPGGICESGSSLHIVFENRSINTF